MIRAKETVPEPSAEELYNPERGFYSIFVYEVKDEEEDAKSLVNTIYDPAKDHLLLVEISLRAWRKGEISSRGMKNLEDFFAALSRREGSYIIRFLYDLEGRCEAAEPEDRKTIMTHMKQLGPLVRQHSSMIFLMQGLFIGNWGEMHGSAHASPEEIEKLFQTAEEAFGDKTFLSVRTPEQWRLLDGEQKGRLGLFNDGIMGSPSDLGSYGKWGDDICQVREQELDFQDRICRGVPNGGEVIGNPLYENIRTAEGILRRMRVSYLNRNHDPRILSRWKNEKMEDPGLWNGMDAFDYIGRHLGYRYEIRDVRVGTGPGSRSVKIFVDLRNVGFAPCYHSLEAMAVISGGGEKRHCSLKWKQESIPGGKAADRTGRAQGKLLLKDLAPGSYLLYFCLYSRKYKRQIYLGNKGMEKTGYPIGRIEIS